MESKLTSKNHIFHIQMLQEYLGLLDKIESQQLDPSIINSLSANVSNHPSLTSEEEEFHKQFMYRLERFQDEVKRLHWMSQHLKVLHDLGQTFSKTFDKEQIYENAYKLVSRVMDVDAFIIAFYDEGDREVTIPFNVDDGKRYPPTTLPFGKGYISKVLITHETVHLKSDNEMDKENQVLWGNPNQNTSTCIFVPMMLNNQIKGVISAQNYRAFAYQIEHEELLRIIGVQVTSAIENAKLYDKVYEMSIKDELTGLKNNRAFHQDLENIMKSDCSQCVTLIMVDSDNLKQVNDMYGHHVGDLLIKAIADALHIHTADGEGAYRYAGDEFMIIAPDLPLQEAKQKAEKIRRYLETHPIRYEGLDILISVSMGIALYPNHAENADELKKVADLALYTSKKRGKNRVTVFAP